MRLYLRARYVRSFDACAHAVLQRESQMEENTRMVDAKKDEFIKRIRLIDQQDAEARARLDVVTAPLKSFCSLSCAL